MIFYLISKNRYYFQSALQVGLKTHWHFTDVAHSAKFYESLEEAERMLRKVKDEYKGPLDNYKGVFKIRMFEFKEI